MKESKVLHSVCVDDIKGALKAEFDIDFNTLTKDKQTKIIYKSRKALEALDWSRAIEAVYLNVIEDI